MTVKMTFGERLFRTRLKRKFTQVELAEKAGISTRALSRYETGAARPQNIETVDKICEVLEVDREYLLGEEKFENAAEFDADYFLAQIKEEYGKKGLREITPLIEQASALFSGGQIDDFAKEDVHIALVNVYLKSKKENAERFTPKGRKRVKRNSPKDTEDGSED